MYEKLYFYEIYTRLSKNFLILCNFLDIAEWNVPKGGMFFWIKIKNVDDVSDLVMNECVPKGYFVLPGHAFQADPSKSCQYIRLCYSEASPENMDKVFYHLFLHFSIYIQA